MHSHSTAKAVKFTVNGIEIHCERYGEGGPLLLLHGGGGAGVNWRLIFSAPPDNYELIIPDLRGHGRSSGTGNEITFRQLALDTIGLLDQLDIKRTKAIGVSMGAKTLLHLATQFPERIEAMVLVSAAPNFPEKTRALMRAAAAQSHSDQEWELMRQWHVHGDEQIKAIWKMSSRFADDYDDMNLTADDMGTIRARTLIVHGYQDPLYPVELAREMHAAIPESSLWIIPDGGHIPIFGDTAKSFVDTALKFLSNK